MNTLRYNTKIKTILTLPILLISTFAIVGVPSIPLAFAPAVANVYLSPAVITDTCSSSGSGCTNGYGVGNTLQYTVTASGLDSTEKVFAFQYEIHFNPGILQAVPNNVTTCADNYGAFQGLVDTSNALPVCSIDNSNGIVSVAVSSLGPQEPLSGIAPFTISLGQVTFQVSGLGRSDQSLQNVILLHNSGGGILTNIPTTTADATFSNVGFFGFADFPCAASTPCGTITTRQAWPESTEYSIAQDNSFTPGILDLFANVNSTGTLPVLVSIRFTLTSSDFGTFVRQTTTHQYDAGQVSVVPQFTGYNPVIGSIVTVGSFSALAQVFYQQVNLDNSLGSLTAGPTIKQFHFSILPSLPTTTTVSCSPTTVQLSSVCTGVVSSSDPVSKLTGSLSFSSSMAGTFSPSSCTVVKGTCSSTFHPKATGSHTVTAAYSGDLTGNGGHSGSSGTTSLTVTGHSTSTVVSCSPGTVNAPTRTTSTCTATVTDTFGTDTPSGTVSFKSSKTGTFSSSSCALVSGACSVTYKPADKSTALGTATISTSYSGDTVGDGHLISSGTTTIAVTGHATSTTVSCSPKTLNQNAVTTCTVKVKDTSSTPVNMTGTVSFSHTKQGSFSSTSCTLSPISLTTSSCSVTFTPTNALSTYTITAAYSGDTVGDGHTPSSGTTTITTN